MKTNLKSTQTSQKNSYTFEPITNYISSLPNTLNELVYGTGKKMSNSSIPQIKSKTQTKSKKSQNNIDTNIESLNNISNISSSLNKSNIPLESLMSSPLETTKLTDLLSNSNSNSKTKTTNNSNYQSLTNNLTPLETLEQPLLKTKSQETNTNMILNYILNISFSTWIIIILILALLGINIFNY